MGKDWIVLFQQQNQLEKVVQTNRTTEQSGFVLTQGDARLILEERNNLLREQKRVEFKEGIAAKIIYEFFLGGSGGL